MVCGSPASGSIARRSPTASSASSSRRPATSPLPRLRRTRRTIPVPCRTCCGRARWSSARRRDRWISATGRSGGSSSSAPTGAGRTGRAARSAGSTTIPSCISPTATRRRTPGGPGRSCRPRPNGSSPRAAGWTAPSSPGATNSRPAAARWRTPGRAGSRTRTPASTATSARRRSPPFRRTATVSTT